MPRLDEKTLRKRCEHNDGEIGSLEELTLHQEDLEKLEHLQHWCKELRILLLHSNLISKIGKTKKNIGKLKKLEYINFSLNNIERIENLEGCESLNKIDFTMNFIGELTSVENLKHNIFLESLYLMGNPCAEYEGYRDYVMAVLPQLKQLDGVDIKISDRILARQKFDLLKHKIMEQERKYKEFREKQKSSYVPKAENYEDIKPMNEEESKKFWSETSENTPETRRELALVSRKTKESAKGEDIVKKDKSIVKLFNKNGDPLCVNQARIPFTLTENDDGNYVLNVEVYRYLDTSYLDVDVQPKYVRVTIKEKIFQMTLIEEVCPDKSFAQRSMTTGHLVITMVKLYGRGPKRYLEPPQENPKEKSNTFLEFESNDDMDFSKIMENAGKKKPPVEVDLSEIPPLIDL